MVKQHESEKPSPEEMQALGDEYNAFINELNSVSKFDDVCDYLAKHEKLIEKLKKGSVFVPIPHFSAALILLLDTAKSICNLKSK